MLALQPRVRPASGQPLHAIRVTGPLAEEARLTFSTGQPPHAFLVLRLAPLHGLAYHAQIDLGDDAADHMDAQALLPGMRAGALVSVAARALRLRTDHGHAVLQLLDAEHVLLLQPTAAPARAAQPTNTTHHHVY